MKKLLLALALILAPSLAFGQCAGVFPAHTVCGNTSASPNVPTAVSFGGTIIGPGTSVVGQFAIWGDTAGSVLADYDLLGGTQAWTGTNTFSSSTILNGALSGTGLTSYFASPPAIGGTVPAAGAFNGLTATGSFTATGLVTNADLAHASTTVNGQTCALGSTCTIPLRPALAGNTDFYIDCLNGNDSNNGTGVGTPWLTFTHAYGVIQGYDLNNFVVTLHQAGTTCVNQANTLVGPLVGANGPASFVIDGAGAVSSIIKGASSGFAFQVQAGAQVTFKDLQCSPGASGTCFLGNGGRITLGTGVQLTTNENNALALADTAGAYSEININAIAIVSNGANTLTDAFVAEDGTRITMTGLITFSGGPTWSGGFITVDNNAIIDASGMTFTGGSPTGQRWTAVIGGVAFTGTGGGTACNSFFPGTINGSTGSSPNLGYCY